MSPLTYALACLFSFSGFFIGILLGVMAKEETAAGKFYLSLIQKAAIFTVFTALLYFFSARPYQWVLLYILLILLFSFRVKDYLAYLMFAPAFFAASNEPYLFYIVSGIIFLFGFPTGSLYYIEMKRTKKHNDILRAVLKNIHFAAISIALKALLG